MSKNKSTGQPISKIEPHGVYDIPKASVALGVSPRTLQQYIREGKIEAKRFGKEYRIVGDNLLVSLGSATISAMQPNVKSSQTVAGSAPISELTEKTK